MLAKIKIIPKRDILDPQGKAIQKSLFSLGFEDIDDVRVGKYIEVKLNTSEKQEAEEQVKQICNKLLANTVIEDFSFQIEP